MLKKFWRISSLKYLAAFLIPLVFVMMTTQGLDNDSWGVLAEGRYIANNGVYYEDVLSMHDGLSTVVQNYGFAVIFYWIFNLFGAAGIYVFMLVLSFLVCLFVYKICMLISEKNTNLSLLLMMITSIVLTFSGFSVTRAQMVSFVIFLALIYVLELYVKTGKKKYLWWIPAFSLAQVNLHASLWPMLFLVILTFMVDMFVTSKIEHKKEHKIVPLFVSGAVSLLLGLINPYGLSMLTVMFKVYGDAAFSDLVIELSPFGPLENAENAIFYILLGAVIFLYAFGKRQNARIRYLLMLLGFLALGLNTIKGLSQVILVMFFPLALLYKNVKIGKIFDVKICNNAAVAWVGGLALLTFVAVLPVVMLGVSNDYPEHGLVEAMDIIDVYEDGRDKRSLKIYTGYNIGGYVEYRGYRAYMDPRGCDFMKKLNGREDILQEWVDFRGGKIDKNEFLSKYSFDYLIAENDPFYGSANDGYELVYKNEDTKLEVYKKIQLVD
ncbi:hypothetical protein IKW73_03245 [Candidatus Saccharibacteria bacterium]|nr:hypothetical protein [Candidatus Saccharibacteria bacterium]